MGILNGLSRALICAALVFSLRPGLANPDDEVPFVRGDPNEDGIVDMSDAVFILNHLFLGGIMPPCRPVMDVNGDGGLDLGDPIHMLTYLFQQGEPPTTPFPDCGFDPYRSFCFRSACPPY